MGFEAIADFTEYRPARNDFARSLRRLMKDGVNEAAKKGSDTAKSVGRFKDQTGSLRRNIHPTVAIEGADQVWASIVAPDHYASYVEEGTNAHWIRPIDYSGPGPARHTIGRNAGRFVKNPTFGAGRGKFLRFYFGGRVVFAREVYHPGSKPYPFMGPAYLASESFLTTYLENGFIGLQARIWD